MHVDDFSPENQLAQALHHLRGLLFAVDIPDDRRGPLGLAHDQVERALEALVSEKKLPEPTWEPASSTVAG